MRFLLAGLIITTVTINPGEVGVYDQVTLTASSGPGVSTAHRVDLYATNYTGTGETVALTAANYSEGRGPNLGAGNSAVWAVAHGVSINSQSTYQLGVYGSSRWGATLSAGVMGLGVDNSGGPAMPNANVLGVYGRGQTNGSGFRAGGYFETGATDPSTSGPSAAVIADSRDGSAIAVLESTGTPVITVTNAGALNFQTTQGAPTNTTAVRAWLHIQLGGVDYWTPLFQ